MQIKWYAAVVENNSELLYNTCNNQQIILTFYSGDLKVLLKAVETETAKVQTDVL